METGGFSREEPPGRFGRDPPSPQVRPAVSRAPLTSLSSRTEPICGPSLLDALKRRGPREDERLQIGVDEVIQRCAVT